MNQLVHLKDALTERSFTSQFTSQRIDSSLTPAIERRFAMELWQNNEKLRTCTPDSFQIALLDGAAAGLSLAPSKGHAYLIPYKSIVKFSPGYRGLIHLSFKAGILKALQVNLVYANDDFKRWTDEKGDHIMHGHTAGKVQGSVTHAYSIAQFMNGGNHIEVMTKQQLDKVQAAAESRQGGGAVWRYWPDQMMKKAVIRRASKYWPMDDGGLIQRMQEIVDKHDPIDFTPQPGEEQPDQEMCISLDQGTVLHDILTEGGLQGAVATDWLKRYAKAKCGAGSIEGLPERLYETAKTELSTRLTEWKKAHGPH